MKRKLLTFALLGAASLLFFGHTPKKTDTPLYLDASKPLEERVEDALARMTTEEKIKILHAQSKFSSAGVPRLGIPELWCTDGPHGIRPEVLWDEWNQAKWTNDSCIAFPALTALAATWNEDMSALYGKSIGEEARYREKDVLLGPGVNIYRTPLCGRNFEYMGEDPCLASRMVVPYIKEVQKCGVAACVKHYALNNHEAYRHNYDVTVSDRALHEIYLPAFKAAVQEGKTWSIMGSYNLYKGEHVCHNDILLNGILKGDWHFDGAVISDWGGTHNTDQAIANGLDLEFGTGTDGLASRSRNSYDNYHLALPYLEKIENGEASMQTLDDKARRVLRLMMRTAMNGDKPLGSLCSPEHYDAAREIAGEAIVLLKNEDNVLPIETSRVKTVAVIGENAIKKMTVGGGSSSLKVQRELSPLDGIMAAAGDKVKVVYERGYVGDITNSYNHVSTGQNLADNRSEQQLIDDAVAAASAADAVIFVGGLNKSYGQDCEGGDRRALGLPYAQDKLIEALASANPQLAVLLVSGNAVAMPWIDSVKAVAQVWYLGSQAGPAIADIVFGDVNPSGKLPFTFPVKLDDNGAHALKTYEPRNWKPEYKEGIYVGYRWAEKHGIKPLFAFGHGLSYTTFEYGQASLGKSVMKVPDTMLDIADRDLHAGAPSKKKLTVTVDVTNSGKRDGKEVVQLYISDEKASVDRPAKELKAFRKVALKAGETKRVTMEITPDMLRWYNEAKGCWTLERGKFTAHIGSASDDIRTSVAFEVK